MDLLISRGLSEKYDARLNSPESSPEQGLVPDMRNEIARLSIGRQQAIAEGLPIHIQSKFNSAKIYVDN